MYEGDKTNSRPQEFDRARTAPTGFEIFGSATETYIYIRVSCTVKYDNI